MFESKSLEAKVLSEEKYVEKIPIQKTKCVTHICVQIPVAEDAVKKFEAFQFLTKGYGRISSLYMMLLQKAVHRSRSIAVRLPRDFPI